MAFAWYAWQLDDAMRIMLEKNHQKRIDSLPPHTPDATPKRIPQARPSSSRLAADVDAMRGRLAFSAEKHKRLSRVRRKNTRRPQTAQVRRKTRMPVW